jgi:hypothetical protein
MTAMRKRHLQRLENRRRANKPWFYPYPLAIELLAAIAAEAAAERAGRPFSRLPMTRVPPSEALERAMRDADRMAVRLEGERAA